MKAAKTRMVVEQVKQTTEDPELAGRFNRVLGEVVEAIEEGGIKYAFIGGIASGGLGRPRSTHDIDLFVMPEDAELALRALAKRGFRTEKTDHSWLYKGWLDGILVDVIFKSKGEIYFDVEMQQRAIRAQFHGRELKLVAPEDLLIIKAAAHSELTPNHWHDAIGLLSHATLDWPYVLRRARRAPRRVLSLLLYAQSNDVLVPTSVIHELYSIIFGESRDAHSRPAAPPAHHQPAQHQPAHHQPAPPRPAPHPAPPQGHAAQPAPAASAPQTSVAPLRQAEDSSSLYGVAHLRECLAEDPRTNELDIQIERTGDSVLLRGEVPGAERRDAVEQIARECFPGLRIENQVRLQNYAEPAGAEEIP
jgi:predicted nucleotidyltransferase